MNRRRLALAVLAASAITAVPALAADHTGVLGNDVTKFEWTGAVTVSAGVPNGVRESVPCATPAARPCEDVLLQIKDAGKLTVKVDGGPGGPPNDDVDVTLYKSDKDGAVGDQVAQGISPGPDTVSAKVVPGYYLAQVEYYRAKGTGYTGVATFAGTPVAAPVVPAATAPPVTSAAPAPKPAAADKRKAKLKKCQKAAKKVKNAKKRKKALKRCAKAAKKP